MFLKPTYTIIIVFLLLNFLSLQTFANEVKGKVTDEKGNEIESATVVLLNKENQSLVASALTDASGSFELENVADGNYALKITMLGYEEFSNNDVNVKGGDASLKTIALKAKTNKLKEVSVRAQRPLIEVKADKIVVNVENSIISSGSNAMEVLSRSPTLNVDQNDNITIKGKQGVTVMIDGKPMAVSGTDLSNILKSMPSDNIGQIEIISNPGAKYDAAGTGGIINIRTRRDKRMGMNGSVNGFYGQGVYPKYGGGINLNYKNKKISSYISYNYAKRWWFNHLKLDRRFYSNQDALQFSYVQDNFMKMGMDNHNLSWGFDYGIGKKTILGAVLTGSTTKFGPLAANDSRALDEHNDVLYYFKTDGHHNNEYYNYSANANLRHRINEQGHELNADIDYARYWNNSSQNFVTTYNRPDGTIYQPTYYMHSDLEGLTQIRSIKADYTRPMNSKAKLEAGMKSSYVTSDNEPLFYEKTTGDFVLDTKRSNHFIYKENINAGYVNYAKDWEKWSTQLGLRVENTNVTAEQVTLDSTYIWSYTQLFPSLAVQRHLGKKHDIGVTLSRRIQRPNYQQLNPFKFFIDNTTYRTGYPYLRPALTYAAELSHTYKKRFVTTFSYSITSNNITQVIQPSETEDSVTVQTDKNLANVYFYSLNGAYPFQVTKWWTSMWNLNLYYNHFTGYLANTNLSNGSPGYTIYTNNSFMLPKGFGAELSFWYQSRQVYAFMDLKQQWMLNAGVQKSLFNNKGTLKLNIQDIFWTRPPRAISTYTNYIEDFKVNRETRVASITFSYRFGKQTVAQSRRRRGGAEDEKNRVGSSGT